MSWSSFCVRHMWKCCRISTLYGRIIRGICCVMPMCNGCGSKGFLEAFHYLFSALKTEKSQEKMPVLKLTFLWAVHWICFHCFHLPVLHTNLHPSFRYVVTLEICGHTDMRLSGYIHEISVKTRGIALTGSWTALATSTSAYCLFAEFVWVLQSAKLRLDR